MSSKENDNEAKEATENIVQLVLLLNSNDISSPESTLNAISISDNNGGRILL